MDSTPPPVPVGALPVPVGDHPSQAYRLMHQGHQGPDEPTGNKPINANRLYFNIATVAAIIIAVASGLAMWFHMEAHASNPVVHLNEHDSLLGGGAAFRRDLDVLRDTFQQKLSDEGKKTRRTLRLMEMRCSKRGDGMVCKPELPLDE